MKKWIQAYVGPHTKKEALALAKGIMEYESSFKDIENPIKATKIRKLPRKKNQYRVYYLSEM